MPCDDVRRAPRNAYREPVLCWFAVGNCGGVQEVMDGTGLTRQQVRSVLQGLAKAGLIRAAKVRRPKGIDRNVWAALMLPARADVLSRAAVPPMPCIPPIVRHALTARLPLELAWQAGARA